MCSFNNSCSGLRLSAFAMQTNGLYRKYLAFGYTLDNLKIGLHGNLGPEPCRLADFLQCSNSGQGLAFHQVEKRSTAGGDIGDSVALASAVNGHIC